MDWYLITARALHFTACVSLTGVFAFECLVAGPIFRRFGAGFAERAGLQRRLRWLAWASLALTLVSGAAWLAGVAANMSGRPLGTVLESGVLGVVLTQTRFGEDWLLRLAFAVLLSACLVAWKRPAGPRVDAIVWAAFGLSALILVTLAWAGHGAADEGVNGDIHLAGDLLHLLSAGTWLGALVPLVLLLASAARWTGDPGAVAIAHGATRRFSVLGATSVGVLLASGAVNTWYLAGSVPALLDTPYGRLLLVKIALFVVMVTVAAVNRLHLTPHLDAAAEAWPAVAQLRRNALIETAIGLGVLAIVGALGIMTPGLHAVPGMPGMPGM